MQQGKKYEPTDENKKLVKTLAAVGITFEDIATKLDISSDTLVKYYKKELDDEIADLGPADLDTRFKRWLQDGR